MKTAGFIGTGKMGGALAHAVSKRFGGEEILLYDADSKKAEALAETLGANSVSLEYLLKNSKYIFLGVKPQVLESVLKEIKCEFNFESIIVSMAAGFSIERIENILGKAKIIRIMPNTPVEVEKGMIVYDCNVYVEASDVNDFENMLEFAGEIDHISEKLIDAASALSGSGPAFTYMFIEAMADAGVKCGLLRDKAIKFAAQTVMGASELLLKSGKHPGQLKDDVCSPGGTTIEGVKTLEEHAFRGAVIDAISKTYDKNKKL